jgi:hypothetical protein
MDRDNHQKALGAYREEMRVELMRNVDQLNELLIQVNGDNEDDTILTRAVCDPSDPLRCALLDQLGNVVRTLSNGAVLRKLKTLESTLRLRQFHSSRDIPDKIRPCTQEATPGAIAAEVRQINTETTCLINKLKYQIRVLSGM